MDKIKIKNGLTNKSFKVEDRFVQEIVKNKFNHNLKYKNLEAFDFVPKLISATDKEVQWEFIEGKKPSFDEESLIKIAHTMRKIHLSDVKLPNNDLSARIKAYLRVVNDKGLKIPEIHHNFTAMNKVLKNMTRLNACHNDFWPENLIEDSNGKIWVVDWEYASMGDRHFDIAYFIESAKLNKEQEQQFLDGYKSYEVRDYQPFREELIPRYKKLVNYITLLWMHAQDTLPFPDAEIRAAMNKK